MLVEPTRAFLGLGGNLGEPAAEMGAALLALDRHEAVAVVAVSSLYRTPPWGLAEQPDFLNAAAMIDTTLDARSLLALCLDIELSLKRVRAERWGPRVIDIDILLYGDESLDEDSLHVPHPRMGERAFVLAPLAEIAPDVAIGELTAAQRLQTLDASAIVRLPGGNDWWRKAT